MSLREKTAFGMVWVSLSSWSVQIITLGISVVLARLLEPKDFGLVALAAVIISFCNILSQSGVGGALIQRHKVDQITTDTAFSINMALGISLAALVLFSAPLTAIIFKEPKLAVVVRVLSVNIILASLMVVPSNLLEREMAFKKKFWAEALPAISYGSVAIGGALLGWGVWSLVVGSITSSSLQAILIWRISHYHPKGLFDRKTASDLWGFGRNIVFASLLLFTVGNVDRVYIGRFFNSAAVGFYSLAMNLSDLPTDFFGRLFNRVMFPAFAQVQTDLLKLKNAYLVSLRYISYAAFPASFGLFAVAEPAIQVIYGEKWLTSVPLVHFLCFFGLFRSLGSLTGALFTGTGKPEITVRILLLRIITLGGLIYLLGNRYASLGVAAAMTLSMAVSVTLSIVLINRYLAIDLYNLGQQILPQFASALVMLISIKGLAIFLHNPLSKLMIMVSGGAAVYFLFLWIFSRNRVKDDLVQIVKPFAEKVRSGLSGKG